MNEEYISCVDYLKSINFENILIRLNKKYYGKRVLLFGTGYFLDAVLDNYDIRKYLDIIGISDKRATNTDISEYKGFNIYNPAAIKTLNISVILDTSILFEKSRNFLINNCYVRKNIIIKPLVEVPLKDKFVNIIKKICILFKYLFASGNVIKTIYYTFFARKEEIYSQINYIKKIKNIKKSNKPLRIAFLCNDKYSEEFATLYGSFKSNENFNVYPIIILPNEIQEKINHEEIENRLLAFKNFNIQAIDGWDDETKSLPCLHAFKPDIVIYQNLMSINEDFSPYNLSKNALCLMPVYDTKTADYAKIGSKFYYRQAVCMWKIFTKTKDDKILFSEYANLIFKNIVEYSEIAINKGILEYILNLKNN